MSVIFSDAARDWLGRAVGAAGCPLAIVPMGGATSSSLFRVERTGAPAAEQYVLRVLDNREWLAEEPDLASHEAAALDEAQRAGLPAPRLVAYADDDVGFGAPAVLMSFIEGRSSFSQGFSRVGWPRWPASLPPFTGTQRTAFPGIFVPG